MHSNTRRAARIIQGLAAITLVVTFFLPLSTRLTYLRQDGRPFGLLGQLFPGPDATSVKSYQYFWDDMIWETPFIFFLPIVLVIVLTIAGPRLRRAVTLASPWLALLLLLPLGVIVYFADFAIFPMGETRSFGGPAALAALVCFWVASSVLAWSDYARIFRRTGPRGGPRPRMSTLGC